MRIGQDLRPTEAAVPNAVNRICIRTLCFRLQWKGRVARQQLFCLGLLQASTSPSVQCCPVGCCAAQPGVAAVKPQTRTATSAAKCVGCGLLRRCAFMQFTLPSCVCICGRLTWLRPAVQLTWPETANLDPCSCQAIQVPYMHVATCFSHQQTYGRVEFACCPSCQAAPPLHYCTAPTLLPLCSCSAADAPSSRQQ